MSDERADTAILLKAIEFASRKHSTQRRKDKETSPYINHSIAVTHLLADTGGVTDLVTLMSAVLAEVQRTHLRLRQGRAAAHAVAWLTNVRRNGAP